VGRARACVDDASAADNWDLLSQRIQEWNLGNVCVEGCLVDGKTLQSLLGVQGTAIATSIRLVLQASALHPCFCCCPRSFTPQCSGSLTILAAPGMPCLKR
jgi:hypothetical protein